MPLVQSGSKQALKENIKRLSSEVGKSAHVKSREQALAVAYSIKRRNRADGGQVFEGPIVSEVPGRTDRHDMAVGAGSYIAPAEFVSHLGENNTLAGLAVLKKMGPQGIRKMAHSAPGASAVISKHRQRARGGRTQDAPTGHPIDIVAAGGEYAWSPEEVKVIGDGDVILGHALLDNLVMQNRKKHIKTLKGLPGPAKD
jgi:hypothetical protein